MHGALAGGHDELHGVRELSQGFLPQLLLTRVEHLSSRWFGQQGLGYACKNQASCSQTDAVGECPDQPHGFRLVPFGIDLDNTLQRQHLEIVSELAGLAVLPRQEQFVVDPC